MNDRTLQVFVALGANLGDPAVQIGAAFNGLQQLPRAEVVNRSALYRSAPMGPQDQPDYVNAVCELCCDSNLDPLDLLDQMQALEAASGRERDSQGANKSGHWGPRMLDLDLLLFGQQQISSTRLTVPHPGILERNFVLVPLLEIAPKISIPGKGPAADFLKAQQGPGLQRLPEV